MDSRAVPVAFDVAGQLVLPEDADRDQAYRCPGCGGPVVLRRGERRRTHFAHRGGEACSTESVLHRAAKHRLVRIIEEWKRDSGPRPCVSRPCSKPGCEGGVVQDLPDDVTHAMAEVRLADGSIADVVLYRGEEPAVAVEIAVTHRVSLEKALRLPLPWMEVLAQDVIERPYWWVVAQDGLRPFKCPACARLSSQHSATMAEVADRARGVARGLDLPLPPSPPYRYAPHSCWRCGSEMVVYLWPGGGGHSRARPPKPVPATVQHRATDGGGDYWANCCPRCSAVQGDYYLERDNADYAMVRELTRNEIWTETG